jgi:hypothetical protein
VCDITDNDTCVKFNHATSAPGNSAEWIVEAPTINGSQSVMADNGSETFTNACLYAVWPNGTCSPISSGTNPSPIDFYEGTTTNIIFAPGPLNSGGFTDSYL